MALTAWAAFLPQLLAQTALVTMASMLFWAALPALLLGWHATTVMSDSMAPRIFAGDVVIAVPASGQQAGLGQVVLFRDPDHEGLLRLHRIVGIDGNHVLTTKGDANPQPDSTPAQPDAVLGVAVVRVPFIGYPVLWFRQHDFGGLAAVAAGLAVALFVAYFPVRGTGGGSKKPRKRGRGGATFRSSTAIILLIAAGLIPPVSRPASASFTGGSEPPNSALSAASTFPCFIAPPSYPALLAYRFGEPSGTASADASGNSQTGRITGGVAHVTGTCVPGQSPAVTFDGSTGLITAAGPASSPTSFSLAVWFRTTSTTGGSLIGFGDKPVGPSAQTGNNLFVVRSGAVGFALDGTQQTSVKTPLTTYIDGAWHQAVVTVSPLSVALYIDGASAVTKTAAPALPYQGYWRIGNDTGLASTGTSRNQYFAGDLSNVAVYREALSAAQVATLCAAAR